MKRIALITAALLTAATPSLQRRLPSPTRAVVTTRAMIIAIATTPMLSL